MSEFKWSKLKSARLKKTRGMSFEELTQCKIIKIGLHPNKPDQELIFFEVDGSVWVIPFVETGNEIFLKTLYKSRKYTKMFKRGEL